MLMRVAAPRQLAHGALSGTPLRAARPCAPRLPSRPAIVAVEAKRVCDITGKKRNKANKVCFSNKKSRTFQQVNLQNKKIYWEAGQRMVKLKLSAKAIRSIKKIGLESLAAKHGVDLRSFPYVDVSPGRTEWKAAQPVRPPMPKNPRYPRKMKNPEKLAASKKTPLVAEYCYGKVVYVRSEATTP